MPATRVRLSVLVLPLVALAMACGDRAQDGPADAAVAATAPSGGDSLVSLTPAQARSADLAIGAAELTDVSSRLRVSGRIEVPPENLVMVSVPMGGYLASSRMLPGMTVRTGEAIAVVQDQQYIELQQTFLTASARMSFLEQEYARQRDLNADKATSDKQFQQTEAEYKTQQAAVRGLAERLRLINIAPEGLTAATISRSVSIRSPITGFVSKVNVSVGQYVTPAEPLFEITDARDVHLMLNVFEKDLGTLKTGQLASAYSNSDSSRKHRCKIVFINRDVSDERSSEVRCDFERRAPELIPGMYMNADIEQSTARAFTVPEAAVVSFEQHSFVFVVRDSARFALTPVETGVAQGGRREIRVRGGVDLATAKIVTKGAYTLLMKLKNTSDE